MITQEMLVARIVRRYPATVAVFNSYGINCMGWGVKNYSLEQAAQVYRLNLADLMRDLNAVAN